MLAIAGGLQCLSGVNDGTIIAMLGVDEWRLHGPVKHGDTIHVEFTPIEKRLSSKGGQGIVVTKRLIKNQRDEIVQSMKVALLYKCRPAAGGEAAPAGRGESATGSAT